MVEPLFKLECKEPFNEFNKNLNEEKINFEDNAVNVDVLKLEKNRSKYNISNYIFEIAIPFYFFSGYQGISYKKYSEKRSSGDIKKHDLLYLARVSKDYKTKYYETIIMFDKIIKSNKNINVSDDNSSDNSSDTSSDISNEDISSLNPYDKLIVSCTCNMEKNEIFEAQHELLKERSHDDFWICYHIMSFGALKKEYKTLKIVSRGMLNICKTITSGKCKNNKNISLYESNDQLNYVVKKCGLNSTQANILAKVKKEKFSLIQGPPGTGKTTMLLAFAYLQLLEKKKIGENTKVLVCAPSNYACDEIFNRLIRGIY